MNEFEQGVEYTDDNLVTMVGEDQAAVEEAAGGTDTDFVADTTEGATDGEMLEEDGELVDEGGREGGFNGGTLVAYGPKIKTRVMKIDAGNARKIAGKTPSHYDSSGAKLSGGIVADKVKGASISSIGNAIKNNKGKAALAAGIGGAAGLTTGLAVKSKIDKQKDDRQGGSFGEGEDMMEESVATPVNFADPVEANYTSIQSAVNYAMQDHRL